MGSLQTVQGLEFSEQNPFGTPHSPAEGSDPCWGPTPSPYVCSLPRASREESLFSWMIPGARVPSLRATQPLDRSRKETQSRSEEARSGATTRHAFDGLSCLCHQGPVPHPSPFLSPPGPQSTPAACEIPPRVQTLALARTTRPTQTHRAATVSASGPALLQGGPPPQQSRASRAAKAGEGHLREHACASGSPQLCRQTQGNNRSAAAPPEVQSSVPAQGKGSEQQETTPGEVAPAGPRHSVPQPC